MLLYDWMWWGHLTNQKEGCAEGCAEGCTEDARRGAQRGALRGVWRVCTEGCMEVFQRGGGEKNQDFMLIRFLNAAI